MNNKDEVMVSNNVLPDCDIKVKSDIVSHQQ